MAFEILEPEDPNSIEPAAADPGGASVRQMPLGLSERAGAYPPLAIAPMRPQGRLTLRDVQMQISHLTGQLETLRRQLREHGADRLSILMREMIEERERELERWLAQERRWDDRIAAIETAIVERDRNREREDELRRERDEARRAAAEAEARLQSARFAVDEAHHKAATMERAAERAQAEQLRLRQERELDSKIWLRERWRITAEAREQKSGGWFSRFRRG